MKKFLEIFFIIAVFFSFSGKSQAEAKLENPVNDGKTVIWNCVYFGNYTTQTTVTDRNILKKLEQAEFHQNITEINGKKYYREKAVFYDAYQKKQIEKYYYFPYEKLKWRVLWTNGKQALLITDRVVEKQPFHEKNSQEISWKNATLRSYLNGYGPSENALKKDYREKNFLSKAFNQKEQEALLPQKKGDGIQDLVAVPSVSDMKNRNYGFINDASRNGNADYWLSDTGKKSGTAAYVYYRGGLHPEGYQICYPHDRIRPLIMVEIEKAKLKFAGCVTSKDEKISASATPKAGEALLKKIVIKSAQKKSETQAEIRWKKRNIKNLCYEIRISQSGNLKTSTKKKTVFSEKYTLKNLAKGKNYDIKIRPVLKQNNNTIYGTWSNTIKIR